MSLLICNQDQDAFYLWEGQDLYFRPVYSPMSGTRMGFNIYMDGEDEPLGTFDSAKDAKKEIKAIKSCIAPVCNISGYYPGEWEDDLFNEMDSK